MSLIKHLLSFIYPTKCPYCTKFISYDEIACKKCRDCFPKQSANRFAKGGYHCYSPFLYKDIFADSVKRFKFKNHPEYSKKLAQPLANVVSKNINNVKFDFVTCVPMHKKKLNKRGYNQAQLLGRDLAKLIDLPYIDALVKVKDNKEQHKCTKAERSQNVKGAYKALTPQIIKNKTILIVDDIVTSGYTLGECCEILKQNGAKQVYCVTVCAATG